MDNVLNKNTVMLGSNNTSFPSSSSSVISPTQSYASNSTILYSYDSSRLIANSTSDKRNAVKSPQWSPHERRQQRLDEVTKEGSLRREHVFRSFRTSRPEVEEMNDTDEFSQELHAGNLVTTEMDNLIQLNSSVAGDAIFNSLTTIDVEQAKAYLTRCGWHSALQDVLIDRLRSIPMRYYIVGDSNSMIIEDKRRLIIKKDEQYFVSSSRWSELGDSIKFVLEFASAAGAITEFRFVNAADPILIGFTDIDDVEHKENVDIVRRVLDQYPSGTGDLSSHIGKVAQEIESSAAIFRSKGQKASVIIATDCYDNTESILVLLEPLKRLPVIVTVRLCTDDEKVLNAWAGAAHDLAGLVDLLDDYNEESIKIACVNPWLTYGLPLHQFRELGMGIRELDILHEDLLMPESFLRVLRLLFGERIDELPHLERNSTMFYEGIRNLENYKVWDPIHATTKSWISTDQVSKYYIPSDEGNTSSCVLM